MSKHNRAELRDMAITTLSAMEQGDMRGLQVVLACVQRCNMPPSEVIERIMALAGMGVDTSV